MHESDAQKTAFSAPYGYYQFNVIRIEERTRHFPKTHGSAIIRITKE